MGSSHEFFEHQRWVGFSLGLILEEVSLVLAAHNIDKVEKVNKKELGLIFGHSFYTLTSRYQEKRSSLA